MQHHRATGMDLFRWLLWAYRPVLDPPVTPEESDAAADLTWSRLSDGQRGWYDDQAALYASIMTEPAPGERHLQAIPGGRGKGDA